MSEAVPSLPAGARFAVEQLVGLGAVAFILACGSFARLGARLAWGFGKAQGVKARGA